MNESGEDYYTFSDKKKGAEGKLKNELKEL
jgi:hypothetical protein